MISQNIQEAFNKQINAELYSSYLYLSMAACFESLNLPGFANWMKVQAREENEHAMKLFEHIVQRGGEVELESIDKPKVKWESAVEAIEDALNHEKKVTGMINDLVDLAAKENDHAAGVLLQWFVSEQVEEEANADDLLQKLKMVGTSGAPLLMLDQQVGKRE